VTRLLKAEIVKRISAVIARQQRSKHFTAATNTDATIRDAVFSMLSMSMLHNEDQIDKLCKYGDLSLQIGGVSNLRQENLVESPAGVGPENDCTGEGQQQL
jgi:hypothetical protein